MKKRRIEITALRRRRTVVLQAVNLDPNNNKNILQRRDDHECKDENNCCPHGRGINLWSGPSTIDIRAIGKGITRRARQFAGDSIDEQQLQDG